jgi:ankyrin repeat protein
MESEKVVRINLGQPNVEVNSKDKDGCTPLAWAARRGQSAIVQVLVERDELEIESKDDDDDNVYIALMLAVDERHEGVVQMLVHSALAEWGKDIVISNQEPSRVDDNSSFTVYMKSQADFQSTWTSCCILNLP